MRGPVGGFRRVLGEGEGDTRTPLEFGILYLSRILQTLYDTMSAGMIDSRPADSCKTERSTSSLV